MTNNVTLLPVAVKIGPFKNFGDFNITNSLKFGFFSVLKSFASRFFFSYRFLFRVLLIWFVVLQLLAIEKRLAIFSDRQQISFKTPTMRLYHGRLNRQNRNKNG